jgi:hypothetical protein
LQDQVDPGVGAHDQHTVPAQPQDGHVTVVPADPCPAAFGEGSLDPGSAARASQPEQLALPQVDELAHSTPVVVWFVDLVGRAGFARCVP